MDELNLQINKRNNDELKDINTSLAMLLKITNDKMKEEKKEEKKPDEETKILKQIAEKLNEETKINVTLNII